MQLDRSAPKMKQMANQADKTHLTALSIPFGPAHPRSVGVQKDRLASFNALILEYQDAAYNFACYLLGDADIAEDVTQQAFINAYLHLDTFRGEQFRSWLFKIIKNACFDELRRQKRRRSYSLDNMKTTESSEPEWDHLSPRPLSPEQAIEQNEYSQQIQAALNRMDESFRTVLVLTEIQELDYQEAARVLGVPLGTVKSRLARARRQFHALFQP